MKTWEKVTAVAMCLALATELMCLAWNIFACFACCCKKVDHFEFPKGLQNSANDFLWEFEVIQIERYLALHF